MLPRYSREPMASLWGDERRLATWTRVEAACARAMAEEGVAPPEAAEAIARLPVPSPARVAEIEAETRHDVLAFLAALREGADDPALEWLHHGMTSSDLLDTSLALLLREAGAILMEDIDAVRAALLERALEHRAAPCAGRTHGMHAEPTTFGLKLLGHRAEFGRARRALERAREEVSTCAVSGAVGTFSALPPGVEARAAAALGLRPEPISTQVIPRDRHAAFVLAMARAAAAVERLATEVRHLQRTEVGEAEEPFAPGQRGSSSMPHKRNPVLCENLVGLARSVRAAAAPALENIALWHERDISHSSVERMILPDAATTLDFALHRLAGVVSGLVVRPGRMLENLAASGGFIHSQALMLEMVRAGAPRAEAHAAVQAAAEAAAAAAASGAPLDLAAAARAEPRVAGLLGAARLERVFDLDARLARAPELFERALAADPAAPGHSAPAARPSSGRLSAPAGGAKTESNAPPQGAE